MRADSAVFEEQLGDMKTMRNNLETKILGALIFGAILFSFQNCGKWAAVGSSEGGVATTASVPSEDQDPTAGGGAADDGGGVGRDDQPPECFTMQLTQMDSPVPNTGIYKVQARARVSGAQSPYVDISVITGHFYYMGEDKNLVVVANATITSIKGEIYFVLPVFDWSNANPTAGFYNKSFCGDLNKNDCYQVPLCLP